MYKLFIIIIIIYNYNNLLIFYQKLYFKIWTDVPMD